MKKLLLAASAVALTGTLTAQNGFVQTLKQTPNITSEVNFKSAIQRGSGGSSTAALGDTILYEDFSNGLAGNGFGAWTNNGTPAAAEWEYRGASTNPNLSVGSRGAYAGNPGAGGTVPIASQTQSNGFIIFDSDYLDNNGTAGNFGGGPAPTPHQGELLSPVMDLSSYNDVVLTLSTKYRRFAGSLMFLFSVDGGTTYTDTVHVFGEAIDTEVNSAHTDDNQSHYVSTMIGGQSNVRMKIYYDGVNNASSTSQPGYYYAMLDDIAILEAPENDLALVDEAYYYTNYYNDPQVSSFGGRPTNYYTEIPLKQAQLDSITFSANIANLGQNPQTNVRLETVVTSPSGSSNFTSNSVNLNPGSSDSLFNTTQFTFSELGTHVMTSTAVADETEDIPVDNSTQWTTEVTDNVYSRVLGVPSGNGWGGSETAPYIVAAAYEIHEVDTVSSLTVSIGTGSQDQGIVHFRVYEFNELLNNGFNATPVAQSDFVTLDESTYGDWFTVDLTDTELQPGKYFAAMYKFSSDEVYYESSDLPTDFDTRTLVSIVVSDEFGSGIVSFGNAPAIKMNMMECVSLTSTITDASCAGDADGEISLDAGNNSAYTFTWDNGASGAAITGLAAGDYEVTVTDGAACTVSQSFTVAEPTALTGSVNVATAGEATASGSGGTAPYSYAWDNGETTSTISVPAGGTVTVTITDANGCTTTSTGDIAPVSTNDIVLASNLNIFPNPTSGQFTISFENIEGVYNVSVVSTIGQVVENRTVTASNSHVESFNLEGLNNGIYFVTVQSESGSEATYRVVVK